VIIAVPVDPPVTTPDEDTEAIVAVLPDHVPPVVVEFSVDVLPEQMVVVPVIASGEGLTVITAVLTHPVVVYEIVLVPVVMPVIIVVADTFDPVVAIDVLELLQVPPIVAEARVVVLPTHNVVVPVITAGKTPTLTIVVIRHPVVNVYEMTEVPAAIPVTKPLAEPMVTFDVALLDHVPPEVVLDSVAVLPAHTEVDPEIVAGIGFTVTDLVFEQPPIV